MLWADVDCWKSIRKRNAIRLKMLENIKEKTKRKKAINARVWRDVEK